MREGDYFHYIGRLAVADGPLGRADAGFVGEDVKDAGRAAVGVTALLAGADHILRHPGVPEAIEQVRRNPRGWAEFMLSPEERQARQSKA
jgi:hypothetical protein